MYRLSKNNVSIHSIHIAEEPIDAIELFRHKSDSGHENDEPIYICDISDVIQKHTTWEKNMPRVIPFYAVKCNNDVVVIQTLVKLGVGFDCASKGEIAQVMSFGVPPERIIYANTNKPVSHLKFAAKMKVDLMTVDNGLELHKISKYYPSARLVLRIRYDAKDAQIYFGAKFGCCPDTEAHKLIELSKSLGLNMIGISFHVGSGCKDPSVYSEAILAARKLFDFAESIGYNFNLLDIGGGFTGDNHTELNEYALVVNRTIDDLFPSSDVSIIAEPGRYYVASAFTLGCQVHSKREIRKNGKIISMHYFINDGMMGSFACTRYQKIAHPLTLKTDNEEMFKTTIWGPTCASEDVLYQNIQMQRLNIEDFLIFEKMGAYSLSLASRFNGMPVPRVKHYIQRKHWEKMKFLCTDNLTLKESYVEGH